MVERRVVDVERVPVDGAPPPVLAGLVELDEGTTFTTSQAAREELLLHEKAHAREGDAIAAARQRLSMVNIDDAVEVTGAGDRRAEPSLTKPKQCSPGSRSRR